MGIYIPNMKMPKVCIECQMEYDNICCSLLNKGFWQEDLDEYKEKLSDCPLVEVAPHGRLIDADKLMANIRAHDYLLTAMCNSQENGMFTCGIQQVVDEADTIIPAAPAKEDTP